MGPLGMRGASAAARTRPSGRKPGGWLPGQDRNLFAKTNGAIYFYSPELLDGEKPGIENQRNLYIYRNGTVHLVATFDPGTQDRTGPQISPDGAHAAIRHKVADSQLSERRLREMYT